MGLRRFSGSTEISQNITNPNGYDFALPASYSRSFTSGIAALSLSYFMGNFRTALAATSQVQGPGFLVCSFWLHGLISPLSSFLHFLFHYLNTSPIYFLYNSCTIPIPPCYAPVSPRESLCFEVQGFQLMY